jgi:hypothetical protein
LGKGNGFQWYEDNLTESHDSILLLLPVFVDTAGEFQEVGHRVQTDY